MIPALPLSPLLMKESHVNEQSINEHFTNVAVDTHMYPQGPE